MLVKNLSIILMWRGAVKAFSHPDWKQLLVDLIKPCPCNQSENFCLINKFCYFLIYCNLLINNTRMATHSVADGRRAFQSRDREAWVEQSGLILGLLPLLPLA